MNAEHDNTITVTLQLHPLLRAYVLDPGCGRPGPLSVPAGTTVERMLRDICGLPPDIQVFAAVNGRSSPLAYPLQDGDRVSVFMAVGGG